MSIAIKNKENTLFIEDIDEWNEVDIHSLQYGTVCISKEDAEQIINHLKQQFQL